MKKWARLKSIMFLSVILTLILMIGGVGIIEAEAYTITYHITVRVTKNKKKKKKPYLDAKKVSLYMSQSYDLILKNAKGKKVKWSTSNKCVKIKKHGNWVRVTYRKKGTCYVKAKYKGKTYKCKFVCKGIYPNAVETYKSERNIVFDKINVSWGIPETHRVSVIYEWPGSVSYDIENPDIISCEWGEWDYDSNTVELTIIPKKPGKTRIVITNSYNKKEKDYINVTVNPDNVRFWNGDNDVEVAKGDTKDIDMFIDNKTDIHLTVVEGDIDVADYYYDPDPDTISCMGDACLSIEGVKRGFHRLKITNDYNPLEEDYINVTVY